MIDVRSGYCRWAGSSTWIGLLAREVWKWTTTGAAVVRSVSNFITVPFYSSRTRRSRFFSSHVWETCWTAPQKKAVSNRANRINITKITTTSASFPNSQRGGPPKWPTTLTDAFWDIARKKRRFSVAFITFICNTINNTVPKIWCWGPLSGLRFNDFTGAAGSLRDDLTDDDDDAGDHQDRAQPFLYLLSYCITRAPQNQRSPRPGGLCLVRVLKWENNNTTKKKCWNLGVATDRERCLEPFRKLNAFSTGQVWNKLISFNLIKYDLLAHWCSSLVGTTAVDQVWTAIRGVEWQFQDPTVGGNFVEKYVVAFAMPFGTWLRGSLWNS